MTKFPSTHFSHLLKLPIVYRVKNCEKLFCRLSSFFHFSFFLSLSLSQNFSFSFQIIFQGKKERRRRKKSFPVNINDFFFSIEPSSIERWNNNTNISGREKNPTKIKDSDERNYQRCLCRTWRRCMNVNIHRHGYLILREGETRCVKSTINDTSQE